MSGNYHNISGGKLKHKSRIERILLLYIIKEGIIAYFKSGGDERFCYARWRLGQRKDPVCIARS